MEVKCLRFISFALFCLCSMNMTGQTEEGKAPWVELRGYIKDMQSLYYIRGLDESISANLIHNRLNFKFNIAPGFTGRLEARNRIFIGELIEQFPEFGQTINEYEGLLDLSWLWIDEKSVVAQSVIDRLLLQYSNEKWVVIMGRQRINWGINNVWNPNDIFNAFNYLDFDYQERPGSDAIRIQHNVNNNSSLDIAFKPGKTSDEHTAGLLYKFNKKKYDFQFLGGIYHTDYVVGAGWAGSIKETGFKGEMSYFIPRPNTPDPEATFNVSLMADQTFKNDWYVSISGLYNSSPTNIFLTGGSFSTTNISAKFLFPFRYNFHIAVIKTLTPITSINFSMVYSPERNTLIMLPTFYWNVATNFDLDFIVQSYFDEHADGYVNQATEFHIRAGWNF